MTKIRRIVAAGTLALLAWGGLAPAVAMDKKDHDHGAMQAPEGTNQAEALGVINAVDAEKRSMNITHEPVEALGWPKMTMDLPVTRRVDLSAVETGAKVRVTLKQGRDKQFRIIAVEKAE